MNPRILERIALYADIDTRRALGFAPRRLFIPCLNIRIPVILRNKMDNTWKCVFVVVHT
jgi:hypothetical protein